MTGSANQEFQNFLPEYDYIPEDWTEARQMIIEYLRKVSSAVNVRQIGWYLEEEVLTANNQFINGASGEYRQIYRFTINTGALVVGANVIALPTTLVIAANFKLIDMWVAATNVGPPVTAQVITDANVVLTGPGVNTISITSPGAFSDSFAVIEYIKES